MAAEVGVWKPRGEGGEGLGMGESLGERLMEQVGGGSLWGWSCVCYPFEV